MVQLAKLGGFTPEKRKVREIINASGEQVTVFEPGKDEMEKIIEYQEKVENQRVDRLRKENPDASIEEIKELAKDNHIQVDGMDVIKVFFPLLTDIEIGDLTDEQINNIVDNPSMALIQAQQVLETIFVEVYKTMILSAKNAISQVDLLRLASEDTEDLVKRSALVAAKMNGNDDKIAKVASAELALAEAKLNGEVEVPKAKAKPINPSAGSKLSKIMNKPKPKPTGAQQAYAMKAAFEARK